MDADDGEGSSQDPWRYVIVVSCSALLFFCPSFNFSHGVLLVALTDTGRYDVTTVTWLLSVTNMLHALGGPIGSMLVSRTSCKTAIVLSGLAAFLGPSLSASTTNIYVIFLAYGVLLGLARGVIFSTTMVSVGFWFRTQSSMATGLVLTGAGVGMLVHPRLLRALVDEYGVQGALLMMGAINFQTCVCGLLIRPSDYEVKRQRALQQQPRQESLKQRIRLHVHNYKDVILKNYSFVMFVAGVCLMMMAFTIIITFLPHYLSFHGSTPQEAALAASILGTGSLVSRVLGGIMTTDPNIGTIMFFGGNCGISGIFSLLLPIMADSSTGRFVYAFATGTYLTCLFVVFAPTTLQKVGLDNLADGFGFLLFNIAIISLIAAPIGVEVKRLTGSYDAVFMFSGCLLFGACGCSFLSEMFKSEKDTSTPGDTLLPKTITVEAGNDVTSRDDEAALPSSHSETDI